MTTAPFTQLDIAASLALYLFNMFACLTAGIWFGSKYGNP